MTFIGGGVFDNNSWPPLPAKLIVDDRASPVTRNLPETFVSPTNEWYRWKPSPRLDSHIHVLLTLDPANYPLGIKGLLTYGDIPVVWTNTQYKMLYMNMGHGDKIFTSPVQNTLIENATDMVAGQELRFCHGFAGLTQRLWEQNRWDHLKSDSNSPQSTDVFPSLPAPILVTANSLS